MSYLVGFHSDSIPLLATGELYLVGGAHVYQILITSVRTETVLGDRDKVDNDIVVTDFLMC